MEVPRRHQRGAFNFNGMSFRHACSTYFFYEAVARLAASGYYGKPFMCGMSSAYALDLLTRSR